MRLINVRTFVVEDFSRGKIPPYAILSHTWGNEEVSLQELRKLSFDDCQLAGLKKIKRCCRQALLDGYGYCWVDTCCIDKSSSAELSEAVNSMFTWYAEARICYVFLADVEKKSDVLGSFNGEASFTSLWPEFDSSKWFTRGWTLQELIAPKEVVFYDANWAIIGKKTQESITSQISSITGIDKAVLLQPSKIVQASVARRMSWAANRKTTRPEDIAYCLLGIFNVNMPLVYGEGKKAFIRLQEEIIKESDDQSLFAWEDPFILSPGKFTGEFAGDNLLSYYMNHTLGILAPDPFCFADAGDIQTLPSQGDSYSMTNKGLRIKLPVLRSGSGSLLAILSCSKPVDSLWVSIPSQLAIPLLPTKIGDGTLGRAPGVACTPVREADMQYVTTHVLYLRKYATSTTLNDHLVQTKINREMVIHQRLGATGISLKRAIFAAKPLTSFTIYESCIIPMTTLTFPPGPEDYVAVLYFSHRADRSLQFMVLLESRRMRQLWGTTVLACDDFDAMETIIEQNVGLFREQASALRLANNTMVYANLYGTGDVLNQLVIETLSSRLTAQDVEAEVFELSAGDVDPKFFMMTLSENGADDGGSDGRVAIEVISPPPETAADSESSSQTRLRLPSRRDSLLLSKARIQARSDT